jgi:hypothetical protein
VSDALPGAAGSGSITAYTVPAGYLLRLELLRFTLATDATAGVHKARVTIRDVRSGYVTATLRDLNEGGPSMTLTYTYGIGLDGSACAAVDGWEMTDALPDTVLAPQTTVTLAAVTDAGRRSRATRSRTSFCTATSWARSRDAATSRCLLCYRGCCRERGRRR